MMVFDAIIGITFQDSDVFTHSRNAVKAISINRQTGKLG